MAFRSGFARMSARRWVIFFEATTRSACVRDELNTSTGFCQKAVADARV